MICLWQQRAWMALDNSYGLSFGHLVALRQFVVFLSMNGCVWRCFGDKCKTSILWHLSVLSVVDSSWKSHISTHFCIQTRLQKFLVNFAMFRWSLKLFGIFVCHFGWLSCFGCWTEEFNFWSTVIARWLHLLALKRRDQSKMEQSWHTVHVTSLCVVWRKGLRDHLDLVTWRCCVLGISLSP